jgi:RNA polymerase sigma-70 factor (ECF subfamily)
VDCRPAILALYDHLLTLAPSPVVRLNRAAALAEVEGPATALEELAVIASDKRMLGYQPYWATLGHLHLEVGNREAGREALTVAIGLSTDDAIRRYLRSRLEEA